jgi:hypothetical protein
MFTHCCLSNFQIEENQLDSKYGKKLQRESAELVHVLTVNTLLATASGLTLAH